MHDLSPDDWTAESKAMRVQAYANAFLNNYEFIFWPFMDITQNEFDEMFGIKPGVTIDDVRSRGIRNLRPLEEYITFREKT